MRKALHADIPLIAQLGQRMHEESRYACFPMNTEKVMKHLRLFIDTPRAIVLVHGDPIHSMFIGFIQAFWWGDVLESFDLVLYVSPEKRGGLAAVRLIEEYKRIAKERGVADVRISTGTGVAPEKTSEFYQRVGFEPMLFGFALPVSS